MTTIRGVVNRMKSNSEQISSGDLGFNMSNELRVDVQPELEEWRDTVNLMSQELVELEKLTQQDSTYNDTAIADSATRLRANVKTVERRSSSIYRPARRTGRGY